MIFPSSNARSIRRCQLNLLRLENRDVPSRAYGLGTNNTLFRFETDNPNSFIDSLAIQGLEVGERIRSIDFQPSTGRLFALGIVPTATDDIGRIYTIDLDSGDATRVGSGPFSTTLRASGSYSMDFNPRVDLIRIVSSENQNLRVNPRTGELAGVDTDLTFGAGTTGPIVAVAYDQNFTGTPTTTLFGIDFGADRLVVQGGVNGNPSPNTGQINDVGSLGLVTREGLFGFDIQVNQDTGLSEGFAAMRSNADGLVRLYNIDLATGQAQSLGFVGNGTTTFCGLSVVPPRIQVVAADASGGPHVKVYDAISNSFRLEFLAYDAKFIGGVRVASGDVNRDGVADIITSPGFGGGPHIRVFDGRDGSQLPGAIGSFLAYDAAFTGGVFVGSADFNNDGFDDIVTGADSGGGPHVKVFSGADQRELFSYFAYDASFSGGVRVAAGDVNGDGIQDIVTGAGPGGGPHVKAFSGSDLQELASFMAYTLEFSGGVFVAAGDVLGAGNSPIGDGRADIITAPDAGGVPLVKVFNSSTFLKGFEFYPYEQTFRGGVRLGVGDIFGNGRLEIFTSGGPAPGQKPVRSFEIIVSNGELTTDLVDTYIAFDPLFGGGVFVAGGR